MTTDRPRIWSQIHLNLFSCSTTIVYSLLRLHPDAAQESRGLGLALGKFTFTGTCDLRMKVKNAAECWWCQREECWCHKIPKSLDRRAGPGKVGRPGSFSRPIWPWPELRSAADPICFHSDDFPPKHQVYFHYLHFPFCLLLWFKPENTMAK